MKERDTSASTAMLIRLRAVRESDTFKRGIEVASKVADALAATHPSVESMRTLGGWTRVIRTAFDGATSAVTFPGPFGTTLRATDALTPDDVQDIRNHATTLAQLERVRP